MQIRRCYHLKVNGTQCGSPALRGKCYCYFHNNYRHLGAYGIKQRGQRNAFAARFPVLEDANSVQAAVMQVIRLILTKEIDSKEAGLLLYALQIASSNLHSLQLGCFPSDVVIDPLLVDRTPFGRRPAREEDFEAETEEEQKEEAEHDQQLEAAQQHADAEWEAETRRQFDPPANTETEAVNEDADSAPRPLSSPTREQVAKLFDARDAMHQHPGDPAYVRAYEAAWAEAGEHSNKSSET